MIAKIMKFHKALMIIILYNYLTINQIFIIMKIIMNNQKRINDNYTAHMKWNMKE